MAPGYLRQCLIVLATKKNPNPVTGVRIFYGQRQGEGLRFWAELGQALCLWRGVHSLRDGHSIGRYAVLRKVSVPFFRNFFMCSLNAAFCGNWGALASKLSVATLC